LRNIKLILEYDGTKYSGWQKQKNSVTIQGTIEKAIEAITKESVELIGCSRTDSGVHAKGYTANFFTNSKIPIERFYIAINAKLPEDIVILSSEEVPEDFHSRFNCIGKTYCYSVLNRVSYPAMYRNYLYHVPRKLSIDEMKKAAESFVGTYDFNAFRNLGTEVASTVRTIHRIEVEEHGDIINILVTGDGFLYNMVRIIAGTLVEVGLGQKRSDQIKVILESKDRNRAGKTAPARGLSLDKVYY